MPQFLTYRQNRKLNLRDHSPISPAPGESLPAHAPQKIGIEPRPHQRTREQEKTPPFPPGGDELAGDVETRERGDPAGELGPSRSSRAESGGRKRGCR